MPHDDTREQIESILKQSFSPLELEVINDSEAHKGHAQAKAHPQAGHFTVIMKSARFDGKNAVSRHRMVYQELSSLMDERIHALSLSLTASDE